MVAEQRDELRRIKTFPQLITYLTDELDWPIESDCFEDVTFDYAPEELGLDPKVSAKIRSVKQLRPLASHQPWGIFFLEFEPKRLPVVVLRRVLRSLVVKQRAGAAHRAAWTLHDLLFISAYGEADERQITFAHFSEDPEDPSDLPALRVLGWDDEDTALHLDRVSQELHEHLVWPDDDDDVEAWRERWAGAFYLRHREVITTSRDLALRLADLAQVIRKRVNAALAVESDRGPLRKLMAAFKDALIHDLNDDDFADMYAQTIAYGLLSARVSRPADLVAENVADMVPVSSPFLKELLQTFLHVGGRRGHIDFDELGVNEVVEVLRRAHMEAVLEDFGNRNPDEDPVIHFYELFLKEYDPEKRMKRGVFYTPRPVVSFIVRSVDEILRTEFGLPDGLADTTTWGEMQARNPDLKLPAGAKPGMPFVQILDPATGTGTFLVEVIEVIHNTMATKWRAEGCREREVAQRWNEYVPAHLLPRLYGFELLMAPYAIAHMKVGLKLAETGYLFRSDVRAGVYLTNALEPGETKTQVMFADLVAEEASAATIVKQRTPITVVIGNPPYSISSQNRGPHADQLLERYRTEVRAERNVQLLSDDYMKFIALAHDRVLRTTRGIVAMITKSTYVVTSAFRGMRKEISTDFPLAFLVDLHGRRHERIGEDADDENVFDIRVGTSIMVLVRASHPQVADCSFHHASLMGPRSEKYAKLFQRSLGDVSWLKLRVGPPYWFFEPKGLSAGCEYTTWTRITDAMPCYSSGVQTHRDHFVVAEDADTLEARLLDLVDPANDDAALRLRYDLQDNDQWQLSSARSALADESDFGRDIVPYGHRPFERSMLYHAPILVDRTRPEVAPSLRMPNLGISFKKAYKEAEFRHCLALDAPGDKNLLSGQTYVAPLYVYPDRGTLDTGGKRLANLASAFTASLARLLGLRFIHDGQGDLTATFGPEDVFHYLYAVLHSPTYRSRYAEFLKIDFPRIPLPGSRELFADLCAPGQELVDLHLLRGKALDQTPARFEGQGAPQVLKVTYDPDAQAVSLNPQCRVTGIAPEVWEFHVGGYQVLEKWLKDRCPKKGNPGRVLTAEDRAHYCKVVKALQETIRLMAEIDEIIQHHGGFPDAFAAGDPTRADPDEPDPEPGIDPDAEEPADEGPAEEDVTEAEAPEEEAGAARSVPIEDWDTGEVMAAFRQAARGRGTLDRDTLLHEVSSLLGYQRLGPRIREGLKNHLKAALRRGIITADGDDVSICTPAMNTYERDELIATLKSVMRKDQRHEREDVIYAVAHHLGFTRVTKTVRDPIKSALNGAIRRGVLGCEGTLVWRED